MKRKPAVEDYYEQPGVWGRDRQTAPQEQNRISQTLSLIPNDARSVVDAGCGDGRILNSLVGLRKLVCGIDGSREALRHVTADRSLASIGHLPFRDRSFDLVMCCEVLEHLAVETYRQALREIERIAGKYVIITVPYAEDLRQQFVSCPACHCRFHPYQHVRSFTPDEVGSLLGSFELVSLQFSGEAPAYPALLIKMARLINPSAYAFPATAICPQCGYWQRQSANESLVATSASQGFRGGVFKILRFVAKRFIGIRKRHIWLLALYRRVPTEQTAAHAGKM